VSVTATGLVDRYLELGLRLGRHVDGLVDAYYGPPELARAVDGESVLEPAVLGNDARRLVADLDGGDEPELSGQRRRWIRGQAVGLVTVAGKLAGEPISYSDEVEACYGVRPKWVDEEELTAAHRRLDESLAGDGPLVDRLVAFRDSHAIPPDRLRAVIDDLAADFRERTNTMFGLPDGERIDFDLVQNEPWSGFNYYLGDLHSRVVINTDLPVLATSIGHLVAHEAYPGHHTEHSRKEVGLVRRAGHREETIFLVGTPQCLLAEGLADLGIEVLLGDDRIDVVGAHLRSHGVRYDTEAIDAVSEFANISSRGRGNLGLLLHEEGRSVDDAIAYAERWFLLDHERAAKSVQFMMDPTWRAYISCYVEGLPLCRQFTAGDPARFERLLTEQLLPADLAAA
jgi:hypothetical protein